MTQPNDWAACWLATVLKNTNKGFTVEQLSSTHLRIQRVEKSEVVVCATAILRFGAAELSDLLKLRPMADFFVNTSRETQILESAYVVASENNVAIGLVGDLQKALELEEVNEYINGTVHFVEQGMRQHRRIDSFERAGNLCYQLHTKNIGDQKVVFFNEYELTADVLRQAQSENGFFDLAVNMHIAGSATTQAFQTAEHIGSEILSWREFFRRLSET